MESADIIAALKEVPAFNLRLLELLKELVKEDGTIDSGKATFYRLELEEAIDEAKNYTGSAQEAVRCLKQILHY